MECSRASRAPQVSAQMLVLATALLLLGIVQQVAIPALAQLRLGSPGSARHLTCSAEHDRLLVFRLLVFRLLPT